MTLKAETPLVWTKSSYSTDEGPDCVEVATAPATVLVRDSKTPHGPRLTLTPTAWAAFIETMHPAWTKSSYSSDDGPSCVEAAATPNHILVRDSKTPHGPRLTLTPTAWATFLPYASRTR
ncbi:DUF397 domain-containing protein [Streptomyces althioticus]|uniref:DUF397 domain-containing protein n=1 Tax=Streptomyces althioticus TaxID=83380 RepID=UPI003EBD163A